MLIQMLTLGLHTKVSNIVFLTDESWYDDIRLDNSGIKYPYKNKKGVAPPLTP